MSACAHRIRVIVAQRVTSRYAVRVLTETNREEEGRDALSRVCIVDVDDRHLRRAGGEGRTRSGDDALDRASLGAAKGFSKSRHRWRRGMFVPSFSPHDTREMFVVTDMSGVFRSSDGGARWQLVDFRQIQGGRLSKVQFTSDPAVLYALGYVDTEAEMTVRPMRSADAGVTWKPLAGWPRGEQATRCSLTRRAPHG